jgi:hypothetical protein
MACKHNVWCEVTAAVYACDPCECSTQRGAHITSVRDARAYASSLFPRTLYLRVLASPSVMNCSTQIDPLQLLALRAITALKCAINKYVFA